MTKAEMVREIRRLNRIILGLREHVEVHYKVVDKVTALSAHSQLLMKKLERPHARNGSKRTS